MTMKSKAFWIGGAVAVVAAVGAINWLSNSKAQQAPGEHHRGNVAERQAAPLTANLIGKPLPNIQLVEKDGTPYSLDNLKDKRAVLFFNEGLMCYPACWTQMVALAKDPRFNNATTIAVSVVVNSPQDWQRAIAKMPDLAMATILFDRGAAASRQLGVLSMPSSMHPGQLPGHTYVLLDTQGTVREIFDDSNMAVNNDLIAQKIAKF